MFIFVEQIDQLEVCLPCRRLLAGIPILTIFQNLRWNLNKTFPINQSPCNIQIFQQVIPKLRFANPLTGGLSRVSSSRTFSGQNDTKPNQRSFVPQPEDRLNNQRTFIQQQSHKTNKINQSRKQIIKMLLVIILVFTACWCPRFLLNIIKWVAPIGEWEFNVRQPFYYFSRIAKLLPVIHAMLNPIIYRYVLIKHGES